MKTKNYLSRLIISLFAAVFIIAPSTTQANEKTAKSIMKAMSEYVGAQKTIQLTFDSSIEIITPQLEKIQFTNSGGALLSRPSKIHAHRHGGYADVEMFFDGKTVTAYGRHVNGYAQFDLPGNLDDLLHGLRDGHGIAMPGSDLLLSDSYETLMAGVMEAKHIGRGIIGGRECEHLAFRNFDTDWQLWVQAGEKPIPCKMVITSKTMNNAPQYTIDIRSWKTDVTVKDESFVFLPPKGAKKLSADDLIDFDELPPSASEGVN